VATAEQKAAAAAKAVAAVKAEAAAGVLKAASEAAAAEAAAAEAAATAAAAAAAAEAKASKGGKDAKGKPAAAAPKAKEASTAADKGGKGGKKAAADKAAAEAAAAAAEPPVAVFEFQFGGVKVPLDRQGAALCLEDSLPEVAIKQVLHTFQTQFLQDMVTFCEEAESSGRSWAGEEEVAATEELEARLRSHRSLGLPVHAVRACALQKCCLHPCKMFWPAVQSMLLSHFIDRTFPSAILCCKWSAAYSLTCDAQKAAWSGYSNKFC